MPVPKTKPHPVDVHVGNRVRIRRTMMEMSQEKLSEALGVTFQQVQKYEKGTNRISASRLWQICGTLKIPVGFLFEELQVGADIAAGMSEPDSPDYITEFFSTTEGVRLNRAFAKIENRSVRNKLIELVRTLAKEADDPKSDTQRI